MHPERLLEEKEIRTNDAVRGLSFSLNFSFRTLAQILSVGIFYLHLLSMSKVVFKISPTLNSL